MPRCGTGCLPWREPCREPAYLHLENHYAVPYSVGSASGVLPVYHPALKRRCPGGAGAGRRYWAGARPRVVMRVSYPGRDRKSVVEGKSVTVRVDLGGGRNI